MTEVEMTAEDNVDPATSSYSSATLPTGLVDDEGKLHTQVVLREMTGEEEDILASRRMPVTQKLQTILERCVLSIGDIQQANPNWGRYMKSLVSGDRLFLLIQTRIASLGSDLSFDIECPNEACKHKSSQTVSLHDFKVQGMTDPKARQWEGVLPKSKKKYKLRVLTANEEERVSKLSAMEDSGSQVLLSRLAELDGSKNVTLEQVKSLPMMDRQYLRADITKHEGVIDNKVEITCPKCGTDFSTEIDIGNAHFFFPAATSTP